MRKLLAAWRRGGVSMTTTATTDLNRALLNIAAAGLRTHCSDPTLSQLWLLDHPGERREAVKLCRHCPVIGECRQAADARGERWHVWAGRDYTCR